MCISDIRLARQVTYNTKAWDTALATGLTMPRNPQRVGMYIGSPGTAWTATARQIVSVEGIAFATLNINEPDKLYSIEQFGRMVQDGWSVAQGTITGSGVWIEFLLPEDVIAAALSEFSRG